MMQELYERQRREELLQQEAYRQAEQEAAYLAQQQQQEALRRLAQQEAAKQAQMEAMRQQQAYASAAQQQQQYAPAQYYQQEEEYQAPQQQQEKAKPRRSAAASASLDDATALAEKGTLLMSKGSYGDSLVVYDKCLAIQLQHLGDRHPIVAHTVDLMGVALLRLGNAEEALETFEKAVYIVEQIYGAGNHPDWAMTVFHAGQAYELEAFNYDREKKDANQVMEHLTDKAYELYEKALEVFQARIEANEPDLDVANVVHAMGNVHLMRGEHMEAMRKFKYALEVKIKLLGEEDASVAWTKCNVANTFAGLYKLDEAIKWYKEALDLVTKVYGSDHPEVGTVHWNLALAYHAKGEVEAQKRSLSWRNRWPFKFFGQHTKKRLIHEGDDFEKMDQHLHHAFDVFVKRFGEEHVMTNRATMAIMAMRELVRD